MEVWPKCYIGPGSKLSSHSMIQNTDNCMLYYLYRSVILPRIGFMMTIPLYSLDPRKHNFFQALSGVQMWRCGSSGKVFYTPCQFFSLVQKRSYIANSLLSLELRYLHKKRKKDSGNYIF